MDNTLGSITKLVFTSCDSKCTPALQLLLASDFYANFYSGVGTE